MSEYVVLIEGELGHRVLCPKKVAEDFLELIKDFNDDFIYEDLSIEECNTVDEVAKYYDYVEQVAGRWVE